VDCSRENTVECLREKAADLLTSKQWKLSSVTASHFIFVPTLDHDRQFLEKSPAELLESGEFRRKNILMGVNSHEGAFFVIYAFPEVFDPTDKERHKNVTYEDYREMVMKLDVVDTSSSEVVSDTIASVYSLPCGEGGNTGNADAKSFMESLDGIFGDFMFKCPVVQTAKAFAREVINRSVNLFAPDQ